MLQSPTTMLDVAIMKRSKAAKSMLYFKSGNRRGYLQREAAEALGLSTRTIRRMLRAGKLLTIVVGRREYISPISIDDLLFEPSRLAKILEEIDVIARAIAEARRPHRTRKLEEHENV
jgi:excisionase family DNA binding protein